MTSKKPIRVDPEIVNLGGVEYPIASVVNLDDYQILADATAGSMSAEQWRIGAALGLAGEAGEICDLMKKHLYHDHDLDLAKLREEAGDLLWYLALFADSIGSSLSEIAQGNLRKLARRYPEGFDPERSKNRAAFEGEKATEPVERQRWQAHINTILKYSEGGDSGGTTEEYEFPIVMHFAAATREEVGKLARECVEVVVEVDPYSGNDEEWAGGEE